MPGKQWNTTVEFIEAKMKKLQSVRHDMYKLDEYLEKQLSVYVARCTGYNVNPKEEVIPKIYELFKMLVEILSDQICGNGPINEKLLILGVTVLYADEQVNYFFEHEGYEEARGGVLGFFSRGGGGSEIVENAPPEDYIRTRGRIGQNDSKYYGALFNLFGSRGCFDAILRRLSVVPRDSDVEDDAVLVSTSRSNEESKNDASSSSGSGGGGNGEPPRLTMDELSHIVKILTKPIYSKWYVIKFQDDFFPKFQVSVFNRLSQLSNVELQKLDQKKLLNILTLVERLLLETIDNFSGDEMLEKFQIELSKTLVTCHYLNKRLLGVEILLEWIQRAERKDKKDRRGSSESDISSHYRRGGGRGGGGGGGHAAISKPKAKWLTTTTLATWLTENHIFEIVMKGNVHLLKPGASKSDGVDSHPSIIQKAMTRHGGSRRNV